MTLTERIELEGQKKLLAIDGGGIRGVLALEVLQRDRRSPQGEERARRLPPRRLLRLYRWNQHRGHHRCRALDRHVGW
jgi:hypothetical protein